jgi:hypothetical protein
MMNCKGWGRKWSFYGYFKVQSKCLPGRSEKNMKNSGWLISRAIFELRPLEYEVTVLNHSTLIFIGPTWDMVDCSVYCSNMRTPIRT